MTSEDPTSTPADPLAPVREALLRQASADGVAAVAAARDQGVNRVEAARRQAERIVARAQADGERTARALVAPEIVSARRQAHEMVLAAQRRLYEELKNQSRSAALELRADPGYPQMMRALADRARAALGPGARIIQSPQGGVVGTRGSLRLDLTLPELVDRALEDMGSEVRRLWTA
jgi:vacuolar-type H+-ATPase subunit E/Vma4